MFQHYYIFIFYSKYYIPYYYWYNLFYKIICFNINYICTLNQFTKIIFILNKVHWITNNNNYGYYIWKWKLVKVNIYYLINTNYVSVNIKVWENK